MPQVQSAVRVDDDRSYEDTPPSVAEDFTLGPPLDYFHFENPVQSNYYGPVPFAPYPALNTPIPAHVAQLYDYTALYTGQPPMDLNLLSSESYPEEIYGSTGPEGGNAQLYGGLLPTSPQSEDGHSLVSQNKNIKPLRSRKPRKKEDAHSTSPDELNAARQRGRPRLDTRDQTAAERRRTQIRLAQRAYRQRKETTISGLNKRVSELEHTIEDMNSSFLDFNDKAIASGIRKWEPSLAQDLKTTMGHFLESARQITGVDEEDEEEEQAPNLSARVYGGDETPPVDRSRTSQRPRLPPRSKGSSSTGEKARPAPWGYDTVDHRQTEVGGARRSGIGAISNHEARSLDEAEWSPDRSTQQYRVEIPETTFAKGWTGSSVEKSLPLPKTSSMYETSFARRLMRQTLEYAFRLMTNPKSSRQEIEKVCKFTFHFANSQQITNHLQRLLLRTPREDLETWEAPQLHLGDAGLHYPRIGLDGIDNTPPAWWAAEAPTGPMRPSAPETPVPKELTMTQIIQLVGFEGEWFDSNDVEQYLRSRGLYLDARSSWVEVEVPELLPSETQIQSISSPSDSSLDGTRGPQSPRMAESFFPNDPILGGQDYTWNVDTLDVPDLSDANMDYSSDETNIFGFKAPNPATVFDPRSYLDPIPAGSIPTFNTSIKKFIDVEKFLSTLIDTSVCLGRTPGFRRSAIDAALVKATHEGW